MSFVLAIELK